MPGKQKGDRRERQAVELYERAGYKVERCHGVRWGRTDWYGHFDLMAVRPDRFRFIQVKSNAASGINEINQWAEMWAPDAIQYDMLVCHDREGWRLIRCWPEGDTYTTVVDERDMDCQMGDGVADHLSDD